MDAPPWSQERVLSDDYAPLTAHFRCRNGLFSLLYEVNAELAVGQKAEICFVKVH